MATHSLSALQVAALLVSASCGIGFLFGSGELALTHGMAGAVYGVATGIGMLLLALLAPALWRLRQPVWELLGHRFGAPLKALGAGLSVVWMSGALAAQIKGGVAVLQLLGLSPALAWPAVMAGCVAAARLSAVTASAVFGALLAFSAVVLVRVLLGHGDAVLVLEAPARVVADLHSFEPVALAAMFVPVVALVCTGTDYHQYLQDARSATAATRGCLLAGVTLLLLSVLPPAVAVAMMTTGEIPTIVGASEVIPLALAHGAESLVPGLGPAMLAALCAAALGCAAALLRAMARALTAAAELHPRGQGVPRWAFDAGALAAAALLCAGGDGIVETMVAANVVYLASIGPLLASMLTGTRIGTAAAACSAAVGLAVAVAVEGMARFAPVAGGPHLAALVGGAACAMLALRGRGVARRAAVAACATSRTGP